jgi:hypothetical protein
VSSEIVEFAGVTLGDSKLTITGKLDYKDWYSGTKEVIRQHKNALWYIGDLLLYGEKEYGDAYSSVVDPDTYSVETAKLAMWVSRRVPAERRKPGLAWSSHREAARLEDPKDRFDLIALAKAESWTRAAITAHVNQRQPPKNRKVEPEALDYPGNEQSCNKEIGVDGGDVAQFVALPTDQAQALAEFLTGLLPRLKREDEQKACAGFLASLQELVGHTRVHERVAVKKESIKSLSPGGKGKGVGKGKQKVFGLEQIREFENLDTDEFRTSWTEWNHYLHDKRKSLSEISACKQLKWLAEQPDPIACIDFTIRKNWQGLREPDRSGNGRGENIMSRSDRMLKEAYGNV